MLLPLMRRRVACTPFSLVLWLTLTLTLTLTLNQGDHVRVCDRPTFSGTPPAGAQVSRIDELVYGFALDCFYRDASRANIQLARRA